MKYFDDLGIKLQISSVDKTSTAVKGSAGPDFHLWLEKKEKKECVQPDKTLHPRWESQKSGSNLALQCRIYWGFPVWRHICILQMAQTKEQFDVFALDKAGLAKVLKDIRPNRGPDLRK